MKIIFFGNCIFTSKAVKLLLKNNDNQITLVSYKDSLDYCVKNSLPKFMKKKNFKYIEFDIKKDDETKIIMNNEYDVLISCAWNKKFSKEVINTLPSYNIHPSLLPKYRGANPLQAQINNHEKIGGVTMHLMSQEYDSGPIYKQISFHISKRENITSLANKVARKTCILLKDFINDFPNIYLINQNDDEATYC